MARSCWACGQQDDGGSTHCVNPACGLPLAPAQPAEPEPPGILTRPCYLRMLALPAGITMVIVLAAVHALMTPLHGPLSADSANQSVTPLVSSAWPGAAGPVPTPTAGPVEFPLPGLGGNVRSPGPAVPSPSVAAHHDGPMSGAYRMRSLSGGCFDIGYTTAQTPMVTQKPCSPDAPSGRFDLQALGEGRYRISAVPQRGIEAGQALCVSPSPTPSSTDRMVVLDGCETGRADQVLLFVEMSEDWYQIRLGGGCVTAMGGDARTRACGNSQTQRFTFTPIN